MKLNVTTRTNLTTNGQEFKTIVRAKRLNLDEERKKDLMNGRGFIISEPQNIKKDIKDIDGILSSRFGQTLMDLNPFIDRYKCRCGLYKSRFYEGFVCPTCGEPVKYVDDDFLYFGWIVIKDPYYIIHPGLYKSIEAVIGAATLDGILNVIDVKNEDGESIKKSNKKTKKKGKVKENPYHGLGMLGFKEKFDEILWYFTSKGNKLAMDYYNDIMQDRDKVFTQSIPVFTTHLRPYNIDNGILAFEGTNAIYNIAAKVAHTINKDEFKMFRKTKPKNKLLYNLQGYYNDIYDELDNILQHKKGVIRQLFGGRCNFTSRAVITSGPKLRSDQIKLPYWSLVELLQQRIINTLQKIYGCLYHEAYKIWYKSQIKKDPIVWDIIESIIKSYPEGLPVLLNRNPTIQYGSIMQMYVIGINDTYTISISLQVLVPFAADFDGDTLNVMLLQNKEFIRRCELVFNPRNAMYISRNDGRFNNQLNHSRDTIINANTLIRTARDSYSEDEIKKIESLISQD